MYNLEEKRDGLRGGRMVVLPMEVFQTYAKHPQVRKLFLSDVGYFPKAANHYRERKEGIEEYILIYCTEGSGSIWLGEKEYHLEANDAFCIPRYQGHRYCANQEDPWSILWVHFKGEDTQYYPIEDRNIIKFTSINSMYRMIYFFELLFGVLEGNYTLGNFIYISQVLSLILAEIYYREKWDTTQAQNRNITDVVRYMYKNIHRNLTLDQISQEFELSKSYLNLIFQESTQHSPIDFFINLKMKEACKILRATDLYIYEVAQLVGYSDQYYFSRLFKKVVGMTPKDYKKSDYFHYNK